MLRQVQTRHDHRDSIIYQHCWHASMVSRPHKEDLNGQLGADPSSTAARCLGPTLEGSCSAWEAQPWLQWECNNPQGAINGPSLVCYVGAYARMWHCWQAIEVAPF
jgi:hypothetical protein